MISESQHSLPQEALSPELVTDETPIDQVPAIQMPTNLEIKSKDDIGRLVEIPLVPACEILF